MTEHYGALRQKHYGKPVCLSGASTTASMAPTGPMRVCRSAHPYTAEHYGKVEIRPKHLLSQGQAQT